MKTIKQDGHESAGEVELNIAKAKENINENKILIKEIKKDNKWYNKYIKEQRKGIGRTPC